MKSDREFIDGIYEKAAKIMKENTEIVAKDKARKEKNLHHIWSKYGQRGIIIAASVCLCIFGYVMDGKKSSHKTEVEGGNPQLRTTNNYSLEPHQEDDSGSNHVEENVFILGEILAWSHEGDNVILTMKATETSSVINDYNMSVVLGSDVIYSEDYIQLSKDFKRKSYVGDIILLSLTKAEEQYEVVDTARDIYYPVGSDLYESSIGQQITNEN